MSPVIFSDEGRKIYSHRIDLVRDSQARRLVADSLQRNPRATWMSTRPIKMCTALYIERDRSHDIPRAPLLWEYFIGVNCMCGAMRVYMCHVCVYWKASFNGNQRACTFISDIPITIMCISFSILFDQLNISKLEFNIWMQKLIAVYFV